MPHAEHHQIMYPGFEKLEWRVCLTMMDWHLTGAIMEDTLNSSPCTVR